uniref:gamma-soluble NSF attachment protein-like isoform X2 n=1 Tax=Vespula vulgaris TaxID=7454 RepID=UPI00214234F5|nr:gamma-soluble NSF attachment protein-like isoform X2 [Vespula vulgaris]
MVSCGKSSRYVFRSIEQSLLICKEMGNLSEVSKLAHSSCSLYQQHGSPESGATVLDKAGKMIESTQPEQALELFKRAADILMGEDSPRQAAEYMSKVGRLLVKLQMYDQAADAIRREIGMHQQIDHIPSVGRLAVALVLVQLARGDQVAAEKAFKEWGNYCDAPEVQTLEMLLQAYDNEDADAARSALNSPFIKHMDVEYAKLARGLPLPQQVYAVPPVGIRANAAESYVSPNATKLTGQATVEAEVNSKENDTATTAAAAAAATVADTTAATATVSNDTMEQIPNKIEDEKSNITLQTLDTKEDSDDYEGGLC